MFHKHWVCLASLSLLVMSAGEPSWKNKRVAEWREADAKQVLSNSPWAKLATPKLNKSLDGEQGIGRMGGIGIGGVGMGRGGGRMGGRGGSRRGGGPDSGLILPSVTVRWQSAMPVQEAELILHDVDAPSVDEGQYGIAVIGLASQLVGRDLEALEGRLKHQGELKREGKKAIRSTDARVLPRDEGLIVLFLFPRSVEITAADQRVEFSAQIGPMELEQSFELSEMTYAGKLEL